MRKTTNRIIGVDPSLGGFAAYRCDGKFWEGSAPKEGDGVGARLDRLDNLLEPFLEWVADYSPTHIVIEGYYGQMSQSGLRLVELGWHTRAALSLNTDAIIYEVAPTTMKMIMVGKGNAKKPFVVSTFTLKYKTIFSSDDLADAFGLMQLGRMIVKDVPTPKEHTKAIQKIIMASL